jgi:hypothetical protein
VTPLKSRLSAAKNVKETRKPKGGCVRLLIMLSESKHPASSQRAARNPAIFNAEDSHGGNKSETC